MAFLCGVHVLSFLGESRASLRPLSQSTVRKPIRATIVSNLAAAQAQRDAHLATVTGALERAAPALLDDLARHGFAVVDDLLPRETVLDMRAECEATRLAGGMQISQSSQRDATTGEMRIFGKHNVLSTALWDSRSSPRSVEYIAALTSVLPALINDALGHAALSNTLQTNKLAVCLGGGSKYDEHIDTHEDGGDPRRLACLLYLQDEWVEEHGGCLRFFREAGPLNDRPGIRTGRALTVDDASVPTDGTARSSRPTVDIAPLGGRLVCFWCESLTHGVTPSYAPTIAAHRWALTVWLLQP